MLQYICSSSSRTSSQRYQVSTNSVRRTPTAEEERLQKKILKKRLQQNIQDRKNSNKNAKNNISVDLNPDGSLTDKEVMSRRIASTEMQSMQILGEDGNMITLEYAFCTQRGYYPDGMFNVGSWIITSIRN